MKIITTLLILLLSCGAASAQYRVDIGAAISGSQGLGSDNPKVDMAGHVVARYGRFGFEGELSYGIIARKTQTHDGRSAEGRGTVRFYATKKMFMSGGFRAGYQSTSLYAKSDGGFLAGGGYDDGVNTVQVLYGHSFGENRTDSFTLAVERLVKAGERTFLSVRPFVTAATFGTPHATDGINRRLNGFRGGVTLAFGWRR